ncbi:GSCOCG00012692001-RA-CDS, partial [Cotesia congregata]
IQIHNEDEKLFICNLYRSPSSSVNNFCDVILELADNLIDLGKIMILGDFNIDTLRNDFYAKRLIKGMSYIGLKQNIYTPTRSTFISDTIIDLVFTNFK